MKTIFEEMGGSYSEVGGYHLPNLIMPDTPSIGIWGQRHLRWLKRNRRVTYTNLLITEQMKAENQMAWVRRMNNIRNQAEQIISSELICR